MEWRVRDTYLHQAGLNDAILLVVFTSVPFLYASYLLRNSKAFCCLNVYSHVMRGRGGLSVSAGDGTTLTVSRIRVCPRPGPPRNAQEHSLAFAGAGQLCRISPYELHTGHCGGQALSRAKPPTTSDPHAHQHARADGRGSSQRCRFLSIGRCHQAERAARPPARLPRPT